ncbi:hypothetical protein ANN_03971 [Periplaneta americana]|uniref:Uncharacterized protein n=1 Tax=Periplaneta americana TaxID=6978 RepID=A0ABQ8T952_PERAM|nr:hypothetical protein ANN_03971 [Periplaneta americana]
MQAEKSLRSILYEKKTFLDFSSLHKTTDLFEIKKMDTEGNKCLWHTTHWLKYVKHPISSTFFKDTLNENTNFRELSLRRCGRNTFPTSVPLIHEGPIPVSKEKKKDLLELLPVIDSVPVSYNFCKNPSVNDITTNDTDLEEADADA